MAKRMWALGLGLLFVVSGCTSAQAGGIPGPPSVTATGMMGQEEAMDMGQMMQMMSEATSGPGAAMILRMGEALDLTDEQRTQLQAMQTEDSDSAEPFMAAIMEAHQNAAAAVEGDSPDFGAYERALRQAAARMVQVHVAMARGAVEARDVLTEEQRQQLMQMMQGMMGRG